MNAHPLAKEMETFWREHAGRHDDPLWLKYINAYGSIIIDKLMEMSEKHSNDGRFGMSKAGGCTRAVALKYLGRDATELSGSTRATFAIGHTVEVMALATLVALGYDVTGTQEKVAIDPFMASATDGRLTLTSVPTNISVKSAGYKMSGYNYKSKTWTRYGFAQYALDGVKATNPGYWAQSQAEMHATGTTQTLLIVVAKDMIKKMEGDPILQQSGSLTFYTELIPYDAEFCASQLLPTWQSVWDSVAAGDVPADAYVMHKSGAYVAIDPAGDTATNKAVTGTYSPCDYCDLRESCASEKLQHQLLLSIDNAQAAGATA